MLTSPGQVARGVQLQSALFLTILGWHQVCPVPVFFLYPGASQTLTLDLSQDISSSDSEHHTLVLYEDVDSAPLSVVICLVLWAFLRDHKSGPQGSHYLGNRSHPCTKPLPRSGKPSQERVSTLMVFAFHGLFFCHLFNIAFHIQSE